MTTFIIHMTTSTCHMTPADLSTTAVFNGDNTQSAASDGCRPLQTDGLHQLRDTVTGEDLDEVIGGGAGPEVLLPTPSHCVQVEDGVT